MKQGESRPQTEKHEVLSAFHVFLHVLFDTEEEPGSIKLAA
jgi:hypothetical protein